MTVLLTCFSASLFSLTASLSFSISSAVVTGQCIALWSGEPQKWHTTTSFLVATSVGSSNLGLGKWENIYIVEVLVVQETATHIFYISTLTVFLSRGHYNNKKREREWMNEWVRQREKKNFGTVDFLEFSYNNTRMILKLLDHFTKSWAKICKLNFSNG